MNFARRLGGVGIYLRTLAATAVVWALVAWWVKNPVLLPPGTLDGQTPGEAIAANRATGTMTSFSLN